jgi:hypothetical protein
MTVVNNSLVIVLLVVSTTIATIAQSGRKQTPQPTPSPTVATPRYVPNRDATTITPSKIDSLLVTAEIIHEGHMKSNYPDMVIKEFMSAMKSFPKPFANVAKGGEMNVEAAKAQAKRETAVHVIWLGVVTKTVGLGDMYVSHIEYVIFVPQTGRILISGELIPGRQTIVGQGGVMTIPKMPSRPSAVLQMMLGAREIANRMKSTGWF